MMSWNKAPNDRGAALILTLGWSAVLLALAGVVSSAVLQQVRPSDNAESSYQAWAAAEAGVDDARNRLSADSEYWLDIEAFNANPDPTSDVARANPALVTWVPVPGSEEGGPEFTYYLDVSGAAEDGRIQVTSSGRAREGDSVVRTVDVLITKRLSTDYAYLSNSEAFPYDLPGAYAQKNGGDSSSEIPADVARVLCATDRSGEEPTYWYQWKPWPGKPGGGPATWDEKQGEISYGATHRNSGACLHSVVSAGTGATGGIEFYGPAHTNDVWYVNTTNLSSIEDEVFAGVVTSSCPDEACDPQARWIGSIPLSPSGSVGGGDNPGSFSEYKVLADYRNQTWNPAYEPVLEMPSDQQLGELRDIADSGGCVFTGPTRIRMTTTEGGAGKVHITSPDTIDVNNPFCADAETSSVPSCGAETPFVPCSDSDHPTVTLNYATMVANGFNGVFYVEQSTVEDPPTCRVKGEDGELQSEFSNYPWVILRAERDNGDLAIVGDKDSVPGLPDQSTSFKTRNLKILNTAATAYADLAALQSAQPSANSGDVYYVVADEDDKSAYPTLLIAENFLLYQYTTKRGGSWDLAPLEDEFDEWTDAPEEQCRNGHVYLEAPAKDGGYTGRYTIAADGDIVITDDIYENSARARTDHNESDWGVPDATSDNQLGLVPDRWLYIYTLERAKGGVSPGDYKKVVGDLLLNVAVLAKDKCLALQDYSIEPGIGSIKVVGALAQNARCRLVDGSAGYNKGVIIQYDDRYKRLGPPPFMPVLSQEPWQAKVWSETTVRRDFEAKQKVPSPKELPEDEGSTFTWKEFLPDGGQLLYVRLLTGAGSVTANTDEGTVSYTPSGGADTAVIEFVVKTSEGLTVGQTITYGS